MTPRSQRPSGRPSAADAPARRRRTRVRRILLLPALALAFLLALTAPAMACGGLVAPGHAEALEKAVTLAAWHAGQEHYVTGFQFAGSANSFGYIIPLPGVPTSITKGGSWTLERLQGEIGEGPLAPQKHALFLASEARAGSPVQVLQQVKIDALDITVVKGGGPDVAKWAQKNGFDLTPDTPKVLGAYSDRGAIFALAKFNRVDATQRGLIEGQGEVIQFTVPTKAPWIPLKILALGKASVELVDAELFVLTDDKPSFFPEIVSMKGMNVRADRQASASLLKDLHGDRGMSWVPSGRMWLTALDIHTVAANVTSDLSIDGGGPVPAPLGRPIPIHLGWVFWVALIGGAALVVREANRLRRRESARVATRR
jgi:hypothetical protein